MSSTDRGDGAPAHLTPPRRSALPAPLRRANDAVFAVFALNGMLLATWLSRVPEARDLLGLSPSGLGRLLLAIAVGSVLALPTAGWVVDRIGAARTVGLGVVVGTVGLAVAGIGAGGYGNVVATAVGLALAGYGSGTWDVAMNVEGADIERRRGRTVMPWMHAAFSIGTVLGAGLAALLTALSVPVSVHLVGVATALLGAGLLATRRFLRVPAPAPTDGSPTPDRIRVRAAWRERRTLLIGLMVLCFALTEGIANDWLAVALVDGYDASETIGAVGFAIFLTAMSTARILGTWALDRWGRTLVLRVGAGSALGGVLLVVFGGSLPLAVVGIVLWGLGAALGFPVGMSAAADDPRRAPVRVSVVASIGYTAFLAGPPLLGELGEAHGVRSALVVVAVTAVLGGLFAAATRPAPPTDPATPPDPEDPENPEGR